MDRAPPARGRGAPARRSPRATARSRTSARCSAAPAARAHPRPPPRRRPARPRRRSRPRARALVPPPGAGGDRARGSTTPSHALGTSYTALTIRNQRTRWGSCSATGAMSFNWRLLLAPEEVLDYVVWHEACHLVVMDHSRRFWALLERHCPRLPRAPPLAARPRRHARPVNQRPRVGVVGHVEWVEFAVVDRVPRARRDRPRARGLPRAPPAAGPSPPCSCARLAGAALFLTALGNDHAGAGAPPASCAALRASTSHAAVRDRAPAARLHLPRRRRTSARSPSSASASSRTAHDHAAVGAGSPSSTAIYFTGGDPDALRAARAARVLVATPRALRDDQDGRRRARRARRQRDRPRRGGRRRASSTRAPRRVVRTRGAQGGEWTGGRRRDRHLAGRSRCPARRSTAYGCGDSFAAGLTYGLGRGHRPRRARCASPPAAARPA